MSRVRTGGRADAIAHLGKAQEFLDAARAALNANWHNAAAGSAVTAGINAKDALSLDRLLGLKDRAQYDRRSVTATEARAAVRRATTMVEAAKRALSQ